MINKKILSLVLVISVNGIASSAFAGASTQIGRYVTIDNTPTISQINPLMAISQFRFPATVKTVGQAVQMVLDNTGYTLISKKQRSTAVAETLTKPLPITDRILGPLSIKQTVHVLMGQEVFTLIEDPLHRMINFKLKPGIADALGVTHGTHNNRENERHERYSHHHKA